MCVPAWEKPDVFLLKMDLNPSIQEHLTVCLVFLVILLCLPTAAQDGTASVLAPFGTMLLVLIKLVLRLLS